MSKFENNPLIGTVIHGTLRPQDLIPAFLVTLRNLNAAAADHLEADYFPCDARQDADAEWWNTEEPSFLLEDLDNALNAAAPEGLYFGSTEGDGSDFGFWPCDDNV